MEWKGKGKRSRTTVVKGTSVHVATRKATPGGISKAEATAAALILVGWLVLFSGGIMVDTRPYRYAISPEGLWAMEGTTSQSERYVPPGATPDLIESWAIVLFFYLPVNLALICVMAGALGSLGNRANLQGDGDQRYSTDTSSPYASAMLRGFFIYLFLTSGLLLLDDNPFDHPSPGQYIRLAGFLSLMSFVVNYQPHVFNQLITWAYKRIEARGLSNAPQGTTVSRTAVKQTNIVHDQIEQIGPAANGTELSEAPVVAETSSARPGRPARRHPR